MSHQSNLPALAGVLQAPPGPTSQEGRRRPRWRCWPQGRGLQSHLVLLVLAAVLPLGLFAVGMILLFAHEEHRLTEQGMRETARALALAMDREVAEGRAALQVLALSRASLLGISPTSLGSVRKPCGCCRPTPG